jgi:hypothetical protein
MAARTSFAQADASATSAALHQPHGKQAIKPFAEFSFPSRGIGRAALPQMLQQVIETHVRQRRKAIKPQMVHNTIFSTPAGRET